MTGEVEELGQPQQQIAHRFLRRADLDGGRSEWRRHDWQRRQQQRLLPMQRGIDLKKIGEGMTGASGAELKAVCTEAGMFALRERRVHVTQEDFEMAVAKVMKKDSDKNMSIRKMWK